MHTPKSQNQYWGASCPTASHYDTPAAHHQIKETFKTAQHISGRPQQPLPAMSSANHQRAHPAQK